MGHYVNPPAQDKTTALHGKKAWLAENGQELSSPPAWADIPKGSCAVCCVDNGPFQAVAVAYNPKELQFFQSEPEDTRPKTWFFLEKTLAVKYSTVEMDDFA